MRKWLDDNDILMYSTNNEGRSVVAEIFMRTLKVKSYKKMTTNESTSYLGYLNKLVEECNNTYHCCIGKKPIYADYSALSEEIELRHKAPKFKVGDRPRITKYKITFSKSYIKNWSK